MAYDGRLARRRTRPFCGARLAKISSYRALSAALTAHVGAASNGPGAGAAGGMSAGAAGGGGGAGAGAEGGRSAGAAGGVGSTWLIVSDMALDEPVPSGANRASRLGSGEGLGLGLGLG